MDCPWCSSRSRSTGLQGWRCSSLHVLLLGASYGVLHTVQLHHQLTSALCMPSWRKGASMGAGLSTRPWPAQLLERCSQHQVESICWDCASIGLPVTPCGRPEQCQLLLPRGVFIYPILPGTVRSLRMEVLPDSCGIPRIQRHA